MRCPCVATLRVVSRVEMLCVVLGDVVDLARRRAHGGQAGRHRFQADADLEEVCDRVPLPREEAGRTVGRLHGHAAHVPAHAALDLADAMCPEPLQRRAQRAAGHAHIAGEFGLVGQFGTRLERAVVDELADLVGDCLRKRPPRAEPKLVARIDLVLLVHRGTSRPTPPGAVVATCASARTSTRHAVVRQSSIPKAIRQELRVNRRLDVGFALAPFPLGLAIRGSIECLSPSSSHSSLLTLLAIVYGRSCTGDRVRAIVLVIVAAILSNPATRRTGSEETDPRAQERPPR